MRTALRVIVRLAARLVLDSTWAYRRMRIRLAARIEALRQSGRIDLELGRTVKLGRDVRLSIAEGASVKLHIGEHVSIEDHVTFDMRARGSLTLAAEAQVRQYSRFVVAGPISIGRKSVVSYGCNLFGAYGIRVGERSGLSQGTSVVDSRHFFTDVPTPYWHNAEGAPVEIEDDVWVGPGVLIIPGVTIGHHCVVGANAVVTRSIPTGRLAVGAPARLLPLGDLDRRDR